MLKAILRRQLNTQEKQLGVSIDYLRHILDVSPSLFLRFASIMPFANSRGALPPDAWFVAQVAALRHVDCAPCLQIGVNLARQSKVDAALLRAAIDGNADGLPADLALVLRFTQSVLAADGNDSPLRDALRQRYGERGLIELAYAISGSHIPPLVKRCLGYAQSCTVMPVLVK